MTILNLDKNFGSHLVSSDFLKDQRKSLYLKYININGNLVKKTIDNENKTVITNIKKLQQAEYGTKDIKLDVTEKINDILLIESICVEFSDVNKYFLKFCNNFLKILCPRCYMKYSHTKINPHNSGFINLLLMQKKISEHKDIFEGFTKCFIAYTLNDDTKLTLSKKENFSDLFCYILVNAKNYEDLSQKANVVYDYYINKKFTPEYDRINQKIKKNTEIILKSFFKFMYPCLKYFFYNKNDIFIRHGLEKNPTEYKKNMIFPPNNTTSGWRIHKVTGIDGVSVPTVLPAYPIEIDKFPLQKCSMHSEKEIYGCVKGFICQKDFKKKNGKIHIRYENNNNEMARDHLFAESEININEWVFTYKIHNSDKHSKTVKEAVKNILKSNIKIVAEEILEKYNHVIDIIINKFIILH